MIKFYISESPHALAGNPRRFFLAFIGDDDEEIRGYMYDPSMTLYTRDEVADQAIRLHNAGEEAIRAAYDAAFVLIH